MMDEQQGHELQIKVWNFSVLDTNNQKFNEIWHILSIALRIQ